jgi:antitoxin (DNA-binding transcriptional repressor) of toxin-antitoxin stability system
MTFLNVHEIKTRFSYFAKQVMAGKSFVICIRNKPFAELRPLQVAEASKIRFGVLKKEFELPDDFNAPLSDFEQEYYQG